MRKTVTFAIIFLLWFSLSSSVNAETQTIQFKSGWNMFSLPLNTTLSTDYIRSQCGSQNKIWNYNSVSQLYEEAIKVLPGRGYWFKVDSACTVSVTGSNVQSIPDLKAGWNQIGAFSQSFNFNDIKGNCNILSGPWKYNPVSLLYESSTTLDPGYGYWIKVSSDCKLMKNCPDGTINGICSATKPKYCDYGNLVDRCNICNCPTGYQCKSDYSCVLMQTCSDGTIGGQCSSNKPLYCDNGNLVNKCSQCGCPINYECQSDGSCVPSPPTTPTCDSTCKAQGFSSGTCKTGGSQGLLPSPVQFNLISNPRDGTGGKTFHTHNTLITMFKTLFDKYPGYASYESIGKTYEGRDIALFKIGNPNGGKVLWDGSLHGWEDAGGEVEYLISKWLLENGTTGIDQTAKRIIERNLILFVPVINMDSYERQNRNFATCNYGTDLNRNFEIGWSSNPCADYPNCYHGSFNVSEKETQAMRSIFQNYKPNFYLNTHYGGGQYVQSASSTSIESNLIQRIKQISSERGVTPYSMSTGNGGGNGMAYGDAKNLGQSSAWFIEINNDNLYANGASRPTTCSCYSHTCDTYQDVVNVIYPRMLPILIGMAESSEVIPTTTTSTCQTGETNIGQDGCSSGICCCSGTITPSQFQININPNSVIGKNNFSIGFMTDWSWLGFISDDARRQLVKDANFKLVRVFDFRTTSPKIMPCYSWDSVKNNCTSWDWTQLDLFTQKVFEIGAEPIFTLGWASQNTQNYIPSGMPINSTSGLPNTGSYAAYASEWVKHFKQKGWPVRYYEIMNEPFAYFGWNPSPSNNLKLTYFVDIWNVVARAMRQQNPNILLSQDALTQTNVLNYWLQYGDNVDYLDFHKYDCGTWNKSESGYYSDEKLFGLAETSRFESTSSTYGVKESQQKWLTSRGKLLPVINSESNLNSAWEGGTDPRIQQMTGAVWKALELRQGIIKGVSYSVYYEFSSNANDGQSRPAKGYGFGMINSVNNTPWYPYYVQKWIGKNLYVGDNLVQSTSSSNNIRALSWINNGKLNLFIIHNSTKSETVSLQGVTGQFNYWKIDDPYGTSYLNPIEQTGAINAGSAITLNGYTVILLQQTITSQTCSDGTAYNQCSATKPKYCSSGTLINSCSVCGCPSGQSCNTTTNACYIPVTCTCGNWTNGACGGSCSSGYRQQTRTCTPTGCTPADGLGTSRCVADASCSAQTGIEVKGIQWFYNSGPNTYSSSAATQALNDLNTTIPHFNYVYLDVWVNASRTDNITVVRDDKDSQYISAIQKARSIGKKVIIRIRHRPSPYDFQPANTDLWLKNFTKAVVDWATFSQQYGVEMFSIVNEFNKWDSDAYSSYWNSLISQVRKVYSGSVIANINNWDKSQSQFEQKRTATWLKSLDYIAVSAYWDLCSSGDGTTVDQLVNSWQPYVAGLKNISDTHGKKIIIITGLSSASNVTVPTCSAPWDGDPTHWQQTDLTAQDNWYEAVFRVFNDKPWIYGYLFDTAWFTYQISNPTTNKEGTVQGKPAAKTIEKWFGGTLTNTCSDGTAYSSCSVTKPKYCSSGTLIDKCSTCGCEPNLDCNTTSQSCYSAINRNYILNYLNESFYRYLGSDVFSLTWVVDSYDILGVSPPDRNSVIKFFDSKQNQTDGTWLSRTNHYVPITAQVLMLYNRSGVKPAKSLDTFFSRIDTWDKVKAEVQTYDSGNYWGEIWGYVQVYVVYKNQAPPWINEFLNEINTNFDSWANYSHQRTHVVMNLYALNLPIPRVDDVVTRTLQQQKVDGSWEYHEPETNFNIGMLGFLRSQTAVDQKLIDSAIAKGVEYIKKCYRTVDCQGKICGAFSKNSTSVDLSVWYTAQGVFATLNPQSDIWSRWVIPKQTSYPTYYSPAIPSNVWAEWRNRTTKENLWKNLWNAHDLGSKIRVAGKSVQGRDIYLFEAGNPNAPALFVDVEIHGNEDHPEEILLMFAYWLLNGEDTGNATAQRIMQKNRILFMPILDTDMSDKSSTGTFKRNNANAVNLNRNFEYNWASSTDPEKGPSAASEPETQTVKSVFTTYKPRVYMNLHTGAFMAHAYGNSSLSNAIIADAPSFSSYFHASYSGTHGGLGFAVSDAVDDSPGVSSWLIEFFRQSTTDPEYNAWMHDSTNLNMNEDRYYPKFQEFLISALSNIEAS